MAAATSAIGLENTAREQESALPSSEAQAGAGASEHASTDTSDSDEIVQQELDEEEAAANVTPQRAQKDVSAPNRLISPFEVRFSQLRARKEFRDGASVDDAIAQIRAVPCEREGAEAEGTGKAWRLEAPFPPIEVLEYACKLRDEQGRPKVDPVTGGEMWDAEDHMFTLDNRRLYCYQKAAVALWPDQVLIDVVELPPQQLTRMRQVRKFRTMDSGQSVLLGARDDEQGLVRWSWREAAGLQASGTASSSTGEAVAPGSAQEQGARVYMRRRNRGDPRYGTQGHGHGQGHGQRHGQNHGHARQTHHGASQSRAKAAKEGSNQNLISHLLKFVFFYILLRIGKHFVFGGGLSSSTRGSDGGPLAASVAADTELGLAQVSSSSYEDGVLVRQEPGSERNVSDESKSALQEPFAKQFVHFDSLAVSSGAKAESPEEESKQVFQNI